MPRRAARVRTVARRATRKPARTAGIKRAAKFAGFSVLGTILANAGAIVAMVLMGVNAPTELIAVTGLLAGSVAAGVYKAVNWVDTGVEMPPPPTPTLNYPPGGIQ